MMSGKCGSHSWYKVVARVLIAAIFIYAGFTKMIHLGSPFSGVDIINVFNTAVAIQSFMGWPYPFFFAWVAGLIELVGGILVATGYYKRYAAWALIVFTLIATYYFHLQAAMGGDAMQWGNVLKNLGLVGGLLLLTGCGRCGACGSCGSGTCGDCGDSCEGGKCENCDKK